MENNIVERLRKIHEKKEIVNLTLDKPLVEKLKRWAEKLETKVSTLVNLLLWDWVNEMEKH